VAGILTYIAIFLMTAIWILGWMGISVVVGSFFSLPLRTVMLVGATLGPLGFIVTTMIGILENRTTSDGAVSYRPQTGVPSDDYEDPFAS